MRINYCPGRTFRILPPFLDMTIGGALQKEYLRPGCVSERVSAFPSRIMNVARLLITTEFDNHQWER
jgi:hypothetical protein